MDENKNNLNDDLKPMEYYDFKSAKEKSEAEAKRESEDYVVDRSERVRNFIANMESTDIDDMIESVDTTTPEHKGEVYFSTAKARKHTTGHQTPKKDNAKKKNTAIRTLSGIFTTFMLVFIVVATAVASIVGISCIGDVLALNRSKQQVTVTVPENTDVKNMISILEDSGLIKNELFCNLFAKFRHMDSNEYLSGVYYMNAGMGLERMLNLAKIAPSKIDTVQVSIPEGYTLYQVFQRLESNDVCDAQQLFDTLNQIDFEYDFIDELAESEGEYSIYEGYLFPDKYEFYQGENPTNVLKKFLENYDNKWTAEYSKKAENLGMTRDQIMIIASIIQKEAVTKEQMGNISSVIHNRLKRSASYPVIECDSTLEYVNSSITPVIGEQLSSKYTKYYDTFTCKGLPAGAICNPGTAAIEAALNPNDTSYFYFLHDNAGNIYLAETFAEYEEKNQEVLIANGAK